jgi:hypothetical protein
MGGLLQNGCSQLQPTPDGSPAIQSSCQGRILTRQYLPELEAEAKSEPADVNDCEEGQKDKLHISYTPKKNAYLCSRYLRECLRVFRLHSLERPGLESHVCILIE